MKLLTLVYPAALLLFFTLAFSAAAPRAAEEVKPFLVVLDPGHGGVDQGATVETDHGRFAEKNITLQLVRALAVELRKQGIEVKLTREDDYDLPLAARTALANKLGADLFISIHLNATAERDPRSVAFAEGVETYILNRESDESSRRLAHFENAVLQGSRDSAGQEPDVALILKDLRLDATLPESKRLACAIQENLVTRAGLGGRVLARGVRQALFYVLLGADMPSALVEAGFITSARDRAILTTPAGQRKVTAALAHAIALFRVDRGTPKASAELARCKVH